MRYPGSEKLEIIRIVEQSHLPAKRTLDQLGVARRTFYRWYDRYIEGGPEALERPCCLLYSTDTVGGNSGSPVLDSDGDLVAINFDRARGGLMNEFAWSQELSRSIGVDVRLMLWFVGTFDGASDLVAEMTAESKS